MKFFPLGDRVVIRRIEEASITASGIFIPDAAKEKPTRGEVVAIGPGAKDKEGNLLPMNVKVGDTVLFAKWTGTETKIDGDEFLIMPETDIMGVIED